MGTGGCRECKCDGARLADIVEAVSIFGTDGIAAWAAIRVLAVFGFVGLLQQLFAPIIPCGVIQTESGNAAMILLADHAVFTVFIAAFAAIGNIADNSGILGWFLFLTVIFFGGHLFISA